MRVWIAILALLTCLSPLDRLWAAEIPPKTLESVVSVLPVWPGAPTAEGAPGTPEGSGIVIAEGGWIATNLHVIGRAEVIRVRLHDGRILPATLHARDVATDIALLKIEADPPPIKTAAMPKLGQAVCAIGNPFGLGLSLSCGVVSATHRSGTGFNPIEDFIQTDAAINPGSSGGALVDNKGRLIGQVAAIFADDSDADIGINFAISTRLLMRVVKELMDRGEVAHVPPPVVALPLNEAERRLTGGLKIVKVLEKTTGIRIDDILVRAGGRSLSNPSDLIAELFIRKPEGRITVDLLRDGKKVRLDVVY